MSAPQKGLVPASGASAPITRAQSSRLELRVLHVKDRGKTEMAYRFLLDFDSDEYGKGWLQTDFPFTKGDRFHIFDEGGKTYIVFPRPHLKSSGGVMAFARKLFLVHHISQVQEDCAMNELIHLSARTIGNETIQTVNARDLHAFLEVGKDFSTWIQDRIQQYGFVENQDFVCSPILGIKEGRGGHNRKDYHLSLDMAKELSMVERNEKGKQARQYFLECEKRLKGGGQQILIPQTLPEALRLAAKLAEEKNAAEERAAFAEETKAWIGSRREATAMNKAAQATKKVNALERQLDKANIQIDKSKDYATVKRMQMCYRNQKFDWLRLKKASEELGVEPINVFDANYGHVNAYHKDVWREAYNLAIE